MGKPLFIELLTQEIERRGLTVRQAAKEIGISHTTLYAVLRGRTMDIDIAGMISKWAEISLDTLVDGANERTEALSVLDFIFRTSPELEAVFVTAAKAVEAGDMTLQDFNELANYTSYLIQRRSDEAKKQGKERSVADHR